MMNYYVIKNERGEYLTSLEDQNYPSGWNKVAGPFDSLEDACDWIIARRDIPANMFLNSIGYHPGGAEYADHVVSYWGFYRFEDVPADFDPSKPKNFYR